MKRWGKRVSLLIAGSVLLFLFMVLGGNAWVVLSSSSRVYDEIESLPFRKVGLVLGCSPKLGKNRKNLFFEYRMDAAAELYHEGKVKFLLVSGDNRSRYYDEPTAMRNALIKRGVAGERVIRDYAGLRTLDSVVRAQKVFQENSYVIISQEFHNYRAVFIAEHYGADALAYNAQEVPKASAMRTRWREVLARIKTLLDLYVLKKEPRFLGESVEIS